MALEPQPSSVHKQPTLIGVLSGVTTRWVLVAVVVIILLAAIWQVRSTLLLLLASIILVVLFTIPIRILERAKVPRTAATIFSLFSITAVVVGLFMVVLPQLVPQFTALGREIQQGTEQLVSQWDAIQEDPTLREESPVIASLQDLARDVFGVTDLNRLLTQFSRELSIAVGQLGEAVLPVVGGVANTLLSFLIVLFLSLYLLAEPKKYERGFVRLFPLTYRGRVEQIIARIDKTLRVWLEGQILLMLIVGVLSWLGLAALGLEQALALGILAGLFSFVPNFGPIAALVPSVAVGAAQAPQNLGWIVLIIYGTSFIQSQVIAPLIFQERLNLPPVMVLIGQIFTAVFFGFLGLMLAVPIIAILMIVVQESYVRDVLGDQEVGTPPVSTG